MKKELYYNVCYRCINIFSLFIKDCVLDTDELEKEVSELSKSNNIIPVLSNIQTCHIQYIENAYYFFHKMSSIYNTNINFPSLFSCIFYDSSQIRIGFFGILCLKISKK